MVTRDQKIVGIRKMKGVTFDEVVLVTKFRSFEQEAVDDVETWYTPAEFKKMRQRNNKLSHALSKAARLGKLGSSRVQFHGIESADQRDQRRKRMGDARHSVLFEQEDIWDEEQKEETVGLVGAPPRTEANLSAATRIAFEYSSYSVEASKQATARAIKNADDVLEVYCNLEAAIGIAARRFSSIRLEDHSATSSSNSSDSNGSPPRQPSPTIQFSSRSVKRQLLFKGGLHQRR
jgi:hypothetical protein